MYLVEIAAGREELYESVNALAAAIRRGEVGPQSRIFHRASSSWISVTLHPEFKKATATRDSEPPVTDGDAGQTAGESIESHGGLRGLLARAFRSLSPAPRTSETSGS